MPAPGTPIFTLVIVLASVITKMYCLQLTFGAFQFYGTINVASDIPMVCERGTASEIGEYFHDNIRLSLTQCHGSHTLGMSDTTFIVP